MHNNISVTCVFRAFLCWEEKFIKRPPPYYVIWPFRGWPRIYFGDKSVFACIKRITQSGELNIIEKILSGWRMARHETFILHLTSPCQNDFNCICLNLKDAARTQLTWAAWWTESDWRYPASVSWAGSVTWFPYPQHHLDTHSQIFIILSGSRSPRADCCQNDNGHCHVVSSPPSARPLNINQNLEILFIWRCLGWVWWARLEKSLKMLT